VKTWPKHNGDVYNPRLPVSEIEKLTGAGDFDAPPGRAAVDAAGRGSNHNTATPSGFPVEILPFNPKHVVLEVFGPPGTLATINYHR
jgi:hypothetical protein